MIFFVSELNFKEFHLSKLHLLHLLGILLFLVASWKQNHYCIMLSNLRKKKESKCFIAAYFGNTADIGGVVRVVMGSRNHLEFHLLIVTYIPFFQISFLFELSFNLQ